MPGRPELGRVEDRKVEKPWGYELRWAMTDRYAGKILHVRKGEALSLQYHERKDESWYVESGRARLELGEMGQEVLDEEVMGFPIDPSGPVADHYVQQSAERALESYRPGKGCKPN